MKFLILGCNGMAGHLVSIYLHEQGHDVIGVARKSLHHIKTIECDVRNLEEIKQIILNDNYDVAVNCIGILNQEAEKNKEIAVFINSFFPHFLAKITEQTQTQVVHLSTDCVFSGDRGQYTESSKYDGNTFYSRTKALGEIIDEKNITIRTSIVGPDINCNGMGLFNWFMMNTDKVSGFSKVLWTGQSTLQLAKTIEAASVQKAHGLYNMVPNYFICKYDLLQLFNKYFKMGSVNIISTDLFVSDKTLIRTNYDGFDFIIPKYDIMIQELYQWMVEHKYLYPHYF